MKKKILLWEDFSRERPLSAFFFLVKEKEGETTMAATSWSEDNFISVSHRERSGIHQ